MQKLPSNFGDNLEGYCLVATRKHTVGFFARTIVLITHHEPGAGTLGLVFNRPTKEKIRDYLVSISPAVGETTIYKGGPVETKTLSIVGLHYEGNKLTLRTHLTPPQAEKFLRPAADINAESRQLRAYLGYAGWDAKQLESEIEHGDWRVMPLTPALLEPMAGEKLWKWAGER